MTTRLGYVVQHDMTMYDHIRANFTCQKSDSLFISELILKNWHILKSEVNINIFINVIAIDIVYYNGMCPVYNHQLPSTVIMVYNGIDNTTSYNQQTTNKQHTK